MACYTRNLSGVSICYNWKGIRTYDCTGRQCEDVRNTHLQKNSIDRMHGSGPEEKHVLGGCCIKLEIVADDVCECCIKLEIVAEDA